LKVNFSKLTADERKEWGFDSPAEVEKVLSAMNPIDIVPLFITTFDVPDVK
jgi:hypothetical protein